MTNPSRSLGGAALLLCVGLLGALTAERLGLPAGLFTGATFAVGVFRTTAASTASVPGQARDIGGILLGTAVGAAFTRPLLDQLGPLLVPTMVATLVLILLGLVLGWVLYSVRASMSRHRSSA